MRSKKPVQSMFKTDGKNVRENYAILFTAKAALTLMDFDITLDFEAEKRVLKLAGVADLCVPAGSSQQLCASALH